MQRSPDASLRWHYPDQVQRVFLTREIRSLNIRMKRSKRRMTQDPRVSRPNDTPRCDNLASVFARRIWQRAWRKKRISRARPI
jgi:hypothetical protein